MSLLKYIQSAGLSIQEGEDTAAFITRVEATLQEQQGIKFLAQNNDKPSWIPKARFDQVNTEKVELGTQLKEAQETIEGSKGLVDKVTELEGKLVNTGKEYQVKTAALKSNVRDVEDISKFIDISSLEVDDSGNITDLDKAIEGLLESKPYLFNEESGNGSLGGGSNPGGTGSGIDLSDLTPEQWAERL